MKSPRRLVASLLIGLFSVATFGVAISNSQKINNAKEATATVTDMNDYSECEAAYAGNNPSTLLTKLREITSLGTSGSYDDLWETYKTAYLRDDGKIFDYYSSITNYRPGTDQAGSYSVEGDVYNREHCIPQSWWGKGTGTGTQGADPYIVVPTDGKVNGMRSNYSFGMVNNATYTSSGGFSKLGSAVTSWGYNGTVFEPNDSVKGDFARIYFYAIAKYSSSYTWNQDYGGSCFNNNANTNFGLTDYAVKLFSYWSELDPVSEWEMTVNDRVSAIQHNRNPFVDHPEYANKLWGSHSDYTQYTHATPSVGITSISKTTASIIKGNTTTISATSSNNGSISWSSSNPSVATVSPNSAASGSNVTITAVAAGSATITASITIDSNSYSLGCTVTVTEPKVLSSISVSNQKTTFVVGNAFSFGGTVTATYADSTTADVTSSATFSGYNMSNIGNQTVTVSYTEGNITKTTTYSITINEAGSEQSFSGSYSYSDVGSAWTLTEYSSDNNFLLCPSGTNPSIATISGIFTDKSIVSDVTITINCATYGSGNNPSSSTFSVYNSSSCSTQVTAAQSGTLPTSSTYTNVIYTVTQANASLRFTNDLAIKIIKPGKQIRLRSITVTFNYVESSGGSEPTLTSITLNTENVTKSFEVNSAFSYTGLVVTAHYSDNNSEVIQSGYNVSSPDMTTTGEKTITVTYLTASASYTITVTSSGSGTNEGTYQFILAGSGTGNTYWTDNSAGAKYAGVTWKTTNIVRMSSSYNAGYAGQQFGNGNSSSNSGSITITSAYNWGAESNTDYYGMTKITEIRLWLNNGSGSISTNNVSIDGTTCTKSGTISKNTSANSEYTNTSCVTYTPANGHDSGAVVITVSSTSKAWYFAALEIDCEVPSGSSEPTLTSLSLSGNYPITFTQGDTFSHTGMTVTAVYSDNSQVDVTSSAEFSGYNMSTTGNQTVTVSYGGISTTYGITVNPPAPTSITATVSKTYYVGETITSSDITVKDNNNNTITGFTFADNNHQFTYSEASSGGTLTNKTFTNSITYSNLTCSLTVQVQRKARFVPNTTTDTITASDLAATSTSYTNFSNVAKTSSARYAGNSAKNGDNIQLRSSNSCGLVSTTSGGSILSVKITVGSGNSTISVYGKNTPYSGSGDLYNTNTQGTLVGSTSSTATISFTTSYEYIGIRASGNAVYISSIEITYGQADTAVNLANYIMYEDTNNQCLTKLNTAIGYLSGLSSTERTTFRDSNDYVISTARARLEAWARSQGKTIDYTNGTMSRNVSPIVENVEFNDIPFIVIISVVSISTIGGYFFLRKRKEN